MGGLEVFCFRILLSTVDCSGNVRDRRSFAACEDRSDEDGHALFIDDPVKFSGVDVISKNMYGG